MKTHRKIIVALLVIAAASACDQNDVRPNVEEQGKNHLKKIYYDALVKSYNPEVLLKWDAALGLAIENQIPTVEEARIYAMGTLAMHDALNMIIPKYESYAVSNTFSNATGLTLKNISYIADAAVSQAAHDIIVSQYPTAKEDADNLLALCLAEVENSEFKTRGVTIGKDATSAILLNRQNDPPFMFTTYEKGTEPGIHRVDYMPFLFANPPAWPEKAVFGANVGSFVPFGIKSAGQFRPGPPNVILSPAYTMDFIEVKKLGCDICPDRTAEQTEIATFWKVNTSGPMNTIARNLIIQDKLNGWEAARLLALTQIAQADANIASFEGKFYYNHWLPISAIRVADTDGNDNTIGDATWTPMVTPPPTPDYPSTPAAAGGASAEVFRLFFRRDNKSFTVMSPNSLPGVTRSFDSFSALSKENLLGRLYVGSHFRNSCIEGEKQGRKIGKYVFENNLREIPYPF